MARHETRQAPSIKVHGGIKAMSGDIRIAQRQQGTKGATIVDIDVAWIHWIPRLVKGGYQSG